MSQFYSASGLILSESVGRWKLAVCSKHPSFNVLTFFSRENILSHQRYFQTVAEVDLGPLASLEYLDLSRNLILEILPGTFLGMSNLKGLDFSVNVVRKVKSNTMSFDPPV